MTRPIAVLALAVLAGCPPAPGARLLVYAFDDGEPIGQLDRDTCIVGAGLRFPIGPTDSVAFDIQADQSTAFLATCDLDSDQVEQCGVFEPAVPLQIDGERISGERSIPVDFRGTDCAGTLEQAWSFTLRDDADRVDGALEATWRLDDTAECDQYEASVLAGFEGNGRVDGCVVHYSFEATAVASCRLDGVGLDCEPFGG